MSIPIGDRSFGSREFDVVGERGTRRCLQLCLRQPYGRNVVEVVHVLFVAENDTPPAVLESARAMVNELRLKPPLSAPLTLQGRVDFLRDLAWSFVAVPTAAEGRPPIVEGFALQIENRSSRGVVMDFDEDGCPDAFVAREGTGLATQASGMAGTPVGSHLAVTLTSTFLDDDRDGVMDVIVVDAGDIDMDGIVDSRILLEDRDEDGRIDRGHHFRTSVSSSVLSVDRQWGRLRLRRWLPEEGDAAAWLPRSAVLSRARPMWDSLRSGCGST